MCDVKIEAPQVQHFLNSRGIQPAVFSPLAPKIVKEEVFAPGEIKVILPPPEINALKGDDQKPKSLNFPFKKPDTLNLQFAKKYDFFDPAQRSLADKELKELAKLEANTEKMRKDMAMMNQVAFMNTRREESAKEKLSQIEAWEEVMYPGNPLNATQQALSNATEQAELERLYMKKVEDDARKEKEMEATVSAGLRELEMRRNNETRQATALEKLRALEAETKERNVQRKVEATRRNAIAPVPAPIVPAPVPSPTASSPGYSLLNAVISAAAPTVSRFITRLGSSGLSPAEQQLQRAMIDEDRQLRRVAAENRAISRLGQAEPIRTTARLGSPGLSPAEQQLQRAMINEDRQVNALQQLRQVEADTRARNISRRNESRQATALQQLRQVEAETRARNEGRRIYDDFTGEQEVRPQEVMVDSGAGIPKRQPRPTDRPSRGLHGVGKLSEEKRQKLDRMMYRNRPITKEERIQNVFAGLRQNVAQKKAEKADYEKALESVSHMFSEKRKRPGVAPH